MVVGNIAGDLKAAVVQPRPAAFDRSVIVHLEETSATVNKPKFTRGRLWWRNVIRPQSPDNQTLLSVALLP
jgi:hypothetical protein